MGVSSIAPAFQNVEAVLLPHRKALAALMRSPALTHGDVDAMLKQLTEVAAHLLKVQRASVWRFDETKSKIVCVEQFERGTGSHTHGVSIGREAATRYFSALAEERTIAADDAMDDPRTSEFTESYLVPNGITSMLDAPVFVGGEMVGLVCHEHIGPKRRWKLWEELVAGTLADFVAHVLAIAQRLAAEREVESYRKHLEELVEERTARLRESEASVRKLFEACPISLVLSRLDTQVVTMTNERAADMFEGQMADAEGKSAPDFWVEPSDRLRLVEAVRTKGRVEGLQARLKGQSGREFSAELAARLVTFEGVPSLLVGVHDVTKQKIAEDSLRRERQTLQTLFAAAPIPLVLTGLSDGVIRFSNQRAADMFGYSVAAIQGRRAVEFYAEKAQRTAFVAKLLEHERVDDYEVQLKDATGRHFWALLSAQVFELEEERFFMVGFTDLTRHKEIEERLRSLATKDSLTELYNRRYFTELGEAEIVRADRYGNRLSMALLDLDHFKSINDTYGHATGDEVLRAFARACRKELRQIDIVSRYGGEEFVVLMPETKIDAASGVLERVRRAVEELRVKDGANEITFTVSVGLVEHSKAETLVSMLKRADEAMYEAKKLGRNRLSLG